ncbi:TPA: hypothetical protein ACTAM0_003209 [Salmonella enterica subsp. enterica serovar Soerenga]|uniref:hypothetical protein n=1 Tax=Salmonella enterica TaxID=28901 RepID=UPI00127D662E|nr:hypothetical protein [Salmonella enterica]EBO7573417.1 hypothetical protein [Salmonella enterica]EBW5465804.1 hypothetical protein [Salmonella enterica subsp. enterica serovar Urbana]EEP2063062.1 hypothetical protein [Salmonella enterica subsp. enterica serovar Soerenga]HBX1064563.1 hypothetical protein [Salmonella enterica]
MARKEIPFIVETEGRDKGKEFLITEMSAWDADSLAQDIFRAMGDSNYSSIPADVIAMGCAGLATVGLSVISASSPEVARQLRDRLMSTVDIVITSDGKRQQRKVNGSLDFEEVSTIRSLLDKVFQVNFDFLTIAGE